jgi:hypothetical protein
MGTTFKDIEKAMTGILNDRQITEEEQEKLDISVQYPTIVDPEVDLMVSTKIYERDQGSDRYGPPLTREQTRELFAMSKDAILGNDLRIDPDHDTYTPEEVQDLINCVYDKTQKEE